MGEVCVLSTEILELKGNSKHCQNIISKKHYSRGTESNIKIRSFVCAMKYRREKP